MAEVEEAVEVAGEVEEGGIPEDAFAFRDVSEEVLVAFSEAEAEGSSAASAEVMARHLGVAGTYLKDERASIEVDYYCDCVRFCLGLALVPMQASVVYGICKEMMEVVKRGGEAAEASRLGETLQAMLVPRCVANSSYQRGKGEAAAAGPVLTMAQGKAVADHVVGGLVKHAALYELMWATGPPEERLAVAKAVETVGWVPGLEAAESEEERDGRLAAEAEAREAERAEEEAKRAEIEAAKKADQEREEAEEADRVRRSLMTRMERRVEDMVKGQVEVNKQAILAEQLAKEAELQEKVNELQKKKGGK